MKFFLLIAIAISLSGPAFGDRVNGDRVNNGGSIAEKNILFAYDNLESYIDVCFQSGACQLTQREFDILSKISGGLDNERMNQNQIIFMSEKATPGFFIVDGEVKVAKTGSTVSSSIYVNMDLLYTKINNDENDPTSIAQGVAILVHELGHHYGNYTHAELDVLGVKVSSVLSMLIYKTPLIPWNNNIYATALNQQEDTTFPDVLIYIYDDMLNITKNVKEALSCPDKTKPLGTILHNLHWVDYAQGINNQSYSVQGSLSMTCKNSDGNTKRVDTSILTIRFETMNKADSNDSKKLQYKSGTLKVQQD